MVSVLPNETYATVWLEVTCVNMQFAIQTYYYVTLFNFTERQSRMAEII